MPRKEYTITVRTLLLAAAVIHFSSACASASVPVIFDTDMGNDVDDALALAMLHTMADRGECDLLGVTLTNAAPAAVPYIRVFNRFYGRESIPVGAAITTLPKGAKDGFLTAMLQTAPVRLRKNSDVRAESAVRVLRKLLASSRERVVIVQVGFSTNLNALLASRPDELSPLDGVALVREKVSFLSAMAGNFVDKKPEYNVFIDAESARQLLEHWPVPIVFSGFEIGLNLKFPAIAIERDFSYAPWHPVVESYRAYQKMPYDRPTWDLTSVLHAVRESHRYFELSEPGRVHVDSANLTPFATAPNGLHRYLRLTEAGRPRVLEALMLLTSQPTLAARGGESGR